MHEHDRPDQGALVLEGVAEEEIVVVFQSHAAEDDDVDLGLHGDAGKKFVVRFAGDGEDRQLLGFDERVEDVDHGNAGTDHVARDDTPGRVDGGAADVIGFALKGRASVAGLSAAVEDAAQEVVAEGDLHVAAKELDLVVGGDAPGAREDLQRDEVVRDLDDLGQRLAPGRSHFRKLIVADAGGLNGDDAAGDL